MGIINEEKRECDKCDVEIKNKEIKNKKEEPKKVLVERLQEIILGLYSYAQKRLYKVLQAEYWAINPQSGTHQRKNMLTTFLKLFYLFFEVFVTQLKLLEIVPTQKFFLMWVSLVFPFEIIPKFR